MANDMSDYDPGAVDMEDLIRLPASSKSRFSLEEQHAEQEQKKYCNSYLPSIGINRGLIRLPPPIKPTESEEPYNHPVEQQPLVVQNPEDLATDLYQCTMCKETSTLWKTRIQAFYGE